MSTLVSTYTIAAPAPPGGVLRCLYGKRLMVPRPLPSHCKSARRMCLFVFQHVCLLVLLHIFSARLLFSRAFCYPKWRDITCFHMCSHVSKFGHTRSQNSQFSSRKLLIVYWRGSILHDTTNKQGLTIFLPKVLHKTTPLHFLAAPHPRKCSMNPRMSLYSWILNADIV